MASKSITVTAAAYEQLAREKRPGESFTDVILRLTRKRSLFDLHKAIPKRESDALAEAYIERRREKAADRDARLRKGDS